MDFFKLNFNSFVLECIEFYGPLDYKISGKPGNKKFIFCNNKYHLIATLMKEIELKPSELIKVEIEMQKERIRNDKTRTNKNYEVYEKGEYMKKHKISRQTIYNRAKSGKINIHLVEIQSRVHIFIGEYK